MGGVAGFANANVVRKESSGEIVLNPEGLNHVAVILQKPEALYTKNMAIPCREISIRYTEFGNPCASVVLITKDVFSITMEEGE